ncbi:MAG: beta-propeller fold lactonase family protein, partial [Bacteroidetes bacterium]|nr:beta-propeller fold lactonase family protein [Bacteroidota bacterium]
MKKLLIFILLTGIYSAGFSQPVISFAPGSFDESLASCNDSVTLPLTVYNTGTSALNFSIPAFFGYAYFANRDNNTVSVLDVTTNTIACAPVPVGIEPWRVEISPDANYVYVSNRNDNTISVISTYTNTVIDTVNVGAMPTGIAFMQDMSFAYVGNRGDNNVMVIDLSTNTVVDTIFQDIDEPQDIVITPDGNYVYVANRNSGVTVIQTSTNNVVANIPNCNACHSIVMTPNGNYVYVSESNWPGYVKVISTATNTVTDSVSTGFNNPAGLDITPDGEYIYVNDHWMNTILIISTASNTIVNSIYDDRLDSSWGLAISADGNYAYVTTPWAGGSQSMVVLDINTNTVISEIYDGDGSRGISTLHAGASWLAGSLYYGSVAPGDSAVIDLSFYASGTVAGTHTCDIEVYSDDPSDPVSVVQCTLSVTGNPVIALSDTCLNYYSVMLGESVEKVVTIFNNGCDVLNISNITATLSEYIIDQTTFSIAPYGSDEVTVTFNPLVTGDYNGTLNIFSNDVDTSLCLNGVCTGAPAISTVPANLDVTLNSCSDSVTQTLT